MGPKTITIIALALGALAYGAVEINAIVHRRPDATFSDVIRTLNMKCGGLVCIAWFGFGIHFFCLEPLKKFFGW